MKLNNDGTPVGDGEGYGAAVTNTPRAGETGHDSLMRIQRTTRERIEAERQKIKQMIADDNFKLPHGYGAQIVTFCIPDGHPYAPLVQVLERAYKQSADGKGKERHAGVGLGFMQQPIMNIGRMVGPGFAAGQVQKKAQEAIGMVLRGEHRAAVAELLGVIVYAASAVLLIEEQAPKDQG